LAKSQKKVDFYFRLPSYVPFVTYADNRSYAKDGIAFGQRFQNNELDNQKCFKIAKLRFDRAQL
jgi:hypothetical protein